MEQGKNPSCLGYIGDEILPRYVEIFNKSLQGSLLNNQDSTESKGKAGFFFVAQLDTTCYTGYTPDATSNGCFHGGVIV